MDNVSLVPYGDKQLTPSGNLYMEQVNDTLYRVKKYRINYIGGESQDISYKTFVGLSNVLGGANPPKFIQFTETDDIVATNQIASVKAYEKIIDTRKEEL